MNRPKVNKADKRHGWKWTEQMDEILIDAFVSQNNIGNRVNGTFTTTAYNNIVNELIERLGQEFNKQLVKNRMKTIKKNFNECYDLFKGEMNGFAWNRVTKMWDAEPEIWKELIKAKPEVKKWMNTPLPNYEKLAKLFEKDKATSEGAEIVSKKAKRGENEMQIGEKMEAGGDGRTIIEDVNHMMANDDVFLEIFEGTHDMHDRSQPATPREIASTAATKSTTSSHSKKRIASSSIDYSGLEDSIREVALAINKGNEILQKRNEILERSRSRVYMEGDVFDELVRLGIDSELLYRAYSFLVEKSGRMRAFFGCPAERRMGYLMMMLNSAGDS